MSLSTLCIQRPVATTLLTLGLVLCGLLALRWLPVAPLPQVDFPTISVSASLPGASPETMAATVATPLERTLGSIAGVTEITSSSSQGSTRVVLQFDLSRDIDSAARDVQAGIHAARALLPSGMPSPPSYRKFNPADAPIMILALTSQTLTRGQMYDAASTVLAQHLSQVDGVGQVNISGGALPAVRVDLNPQQLAAHGIALDQVRQKLLQSGVNRPTGDVEDATRRWQIGTNDQMFTAQEYGETVLRYGSREGVNTNTSTSTGAGAGAGGVLRLRDVAHVHDSVQDVRNYGAANGKPSILLIVYRQPGANIITTVEQVHHLMPQLRGMIPAAIDLDVIMDRTPTIRASLREVERALLISIGLVIMVVLVFLRRVRSALIPAVVVPASLAGTFAVMYLCGYSLDNLSLMALTIATGFVVDDAIVMLENITRHIERGLTPVQAALHGAREISFTVVSISLSLVAVFIPILLMDGMVGRLFREFAVVLCVAILISMLLSLTTTPMMCATLLRPQNAHAPASRWALGWRAVHRAMMRLYRRTLALALRWQPLTLLALGTVVALNIYLYITIPKGFFPQQDTGRLMLNIRADQATSFQAMQQHLIRFMDTVRADPAVTTVSGFTGGARRNAAFMFISLRPLKERQANMQQVMARLRTQLGKEPGVTFFMIPVQDIRVGARSSNSQFQYTLQADSLEDLRTWEPKIRTALARLPELTEVDTDQDDKGVQTFIHMDRDQIARLGLDMQAVSTHLYNAFGQRQVSVIYNPLNQYRVVIEVAPRYLEDPQSLHQLLFTSRTGAQVPLAAFARVELSSAPLSVSHQDGVPESTVSFNLAPGISLSQATQAIEQTVSTLGIPVSVRASFQGTAQAFSQSSSTQLWLILAAIVTIYLVLGILYENLVHPITILSTLPSAGVGALLALMLTQTEFSLIALIGVILLIGIVKKNAIMMIDFALARMRQAQAQGITLTPAQAIYRACQLRVRPILMTTVAAILGAVPLALGTGDGAELRQPLGITVVGGLILSQLLTLYTTPVVFVGMERLRMAWHRRIQGSTTSGNAHPTPNVAIPAPVNHV